MVQISYAGRVDADYTCCNYHSFCNPGFLQVIYAGIILLIAAVYIVARWTVKRMNREDYVDHRRPVNEWLIKAASGLPAVVILWLVSNVPVTNWVRLFSASFLCATWYFLLFDMTMGFLLHKGIFYKGTVWAGRAKTASVPFVAKIALCVISTYLYYIS